jgi:hypothetical protein
MKTTTANGTSERTRQEIQDDLASVRRQVGLLLEAREEAMKCRDYVWRREIDDHTRSTCSAGWTTCGPS